MESYDHENVYQGLTEQILFPDAKYDRMDAAFLAKISSLGYGRRFRVIIVKTRDKQEQAPASQIEKTIRIRFNIKLTTVWEDVILCILPESLTNLPQIEEIYHALNTEYGEIRIAGGTIKEKLEDCHQGLQEAIRTYDLIDTMRKHKENLLLYEDLGIFGLLYDLNQSTVFETFYNGMFQKLWKYDEDHESHLFETLECYFACDCSREETAGKLFIHENTLRYRLRQIEEIMEWDLKNVNTIADIVTAFKVRRMMEILDKV